MSRPFFSLTLCLALLLFTGCGEDGSLMQAKKPSSGSDLFSNYVAIGNSITAGYQSGGINANTQQESYAVLLAERMDTDFDVPLLQMPGCPPPLQNPLTGKRVGTVPGPTDCALRKTPVSETINNVAVPGSEVVDVLTNSAKGPFGSNSNALTTILLGGRTQLQAALDANPTFVSIWTGNNDVLGAALAGEADLITPAKLFKKRYKSMLDSLQDHGVEDGVLIGVANVTLVPALQPGAFYLGLAQSQAGQKTLPDNFGVAKSCAPQANGTRPVSFSFLGNLITRAKQSDQQVTFNCSGDPGTLTSSETKALAKAVSTYNKFIAAQAQKRGFLYVNPNKLFKAQQAKIPSCTPSADGGFKNCPDFTSKNPFGPLFSLDGVHPTARTHKLIASAVTAAIAEKYPDSGIAAVQ